MTRRRCHLVEGGDGRADDHGRVVVHEAADEFGERVSLVVVDAAKIILSSLVRPPRRRNKVRLPENLGDRMRCGLPHIRGCVFHALPYGKDNEWYNNLNTDA